MSRGDSISGSEFPIDILRVYSPPDEEQATISHLFVSEDWPLHCGADGVLRIHILSLLVVPSPQDAEQGRHGDHLLHNAE